MAYTIEEKKKLVDEICNYVSQGDSLRRACDKSSVKKSTFMDWVKEDENFADQYARSRELCIEAKFESIQDDYLETPRVDPETGKIDPAWVNLQRLKIDAKKWELSKLMPKKYGDKIDVDHTTKGDRITVISLGSGVNPNE